MRTMGPRPLSVLRSALSILAVYALVIQSVLAGIVVSQNMRLAGGEAVLCVTHEDGRAAPEQTPNDHSDCLQCLLCVGTHVNVALHDVPLGAIDRGSTISWRGSDWRAPALFKSHSARPRGPPLAV
jgi:hypothetical protein